MFDWVNIWVTRPCRVESTEQQQKAHGMSIVQQSCSNRVMMTPLYTSSLFNNYRWQWQTETNDCNQQYQYRPMAATTTGKHTTSETNQDSNRRLGNKTTTTTITATNTTPVPGRPAATQNSDSQAIATATSNQWPTTSDTNSDRDGDLWKHQRQLLATAIGYCNILRPASLTATEIETCENISDSYWRQR